jgi:hypothetical protein
MSSLGVKTTTGGTTTGLTTAGLATTFVGVLLFVAEKAKGMTTETSMTKLRKDRIVIL